jgi:transposase
METTTALEEITQAMMTTKDRRMYERYQTIFLHLQKKEVLTIAQTINRSTNTVRSYIKAYKKAGLSGLQMNHSPGAPVRLSIEKIEKLTQTIVESIPHEVGFTARHNWTLELIAAYIEREFKAAYSIRGVSIMMHRLGLSYTKPTYTLAAADESKQKAFVESTFPELKKDI